MTAGALPTVADVYPMSPTQAGMVFHTLAEPGAGIYLVQVVHELRGPVDADLLEECIQQLMVRHELLRTGFVWEGMGQPLQVVHQASKEPVARHDWSGRSEAQDELLAQLVAADRERGIELGPEPAVRVALVTSAPDHHHILWTFHHALLDGWSMQLLVAELFQIYASASVGEDAKPPERRPFRDFIAWLDGQDAEAAMEYWTGQLAGFDSPTSLRTKPSVAGSITPTDRRTVKQSVPAELAEQLRSFATSHRLTLNTVVQGAWALLLGRSTDRDDVVFGVTTAGRPAELAGVEDMVGMFLTTVPCRVHIDGDQGLTRWLRDLQAGSIHRIKFEHTPLVDLHRWSDLPSGVPLFDSILVFENVPRSRPESSVQVRNAEYIDTSNYPLALIVEPVDGLNLKMVSDPAVYEAAEVDLIVGRLVRILEQMTSMPDARIDDLTALSRADIEHLRQWNDTANELADDRLIHDLIDEHAARSPDVVAVTSGNEAITYGELASRTDRLATELRQAGVRPNTFVGVHLPRSVGAVVAIVGILKAGGAYLPLDPVYPDERLGFMLDDAEVGILITSALGLGESTMLQDRAVATADLEDGLALVTTGARPSGSVVGQPPGVGDLAYMIYTSGSTGAPNGVPIDHARLAFSTEARFDYYDAKPEAFLLLSSLSFDSSMVGLFWTLAAGGRLVLPDAEEHLDPRALGRVIAGHGVTHTLCLPSLYRLLLEHLDRERLATLRAVIVAGEECQPDLVELHRALLPDTQLHNEYGPTEATVWCTVHRCDTAPGPVPIGRPIANTRIALLDSRLRPVPGGVAGEIFVAGPGVAEGYHRRPELTADRFVELAAADLPFTSDAAGSMRLFRTGDVGRYRADGELEFLGRTDGQVKIRGFRVELGEVESALREHPGVAEVAVLAVDDGAGGYLAAYAEGSGDSALTLEDAQAFLRTSLPDHMVPGSLAVIDSMPRLPNGKADRKALASLDAPLSRPAPSPPRDELERQLFDIWSEVLPEASIGVDDDFFMVGGHSILAVSLVEKIRRATGRELRLATLLSAPTIAGQAELLREAEAPPPETSIVALKADGSSRPLYMVPAAAGTALSFRQFANHLPTAQPLFAFEPLGTDGVGAPQWSIEEMARRYIADMRSAQPTGPYRIGGSCMGGHVAWEMANQLSRSGHAVETVVVLDGAPPDNGPTWETVPRERSIRHLVQAALRHLRSGRFAPTARAWWRRTQSDRRFGVLREAHLAAQKDYRAPVLDVEVFLVQSEQYAAKPSILERWSALSGKRVAPVVIPGASHREVLSEDPSQIRRMAEAVSQHLASLDRSAEGGAE